MGDSLKLSVCIPVYNVAPYVEQCARSLFAQTYADIEYIFVDDCSPDDSMAIIRRVLEEFPQRAAQVRFLRHETNQGLVAARRTAIAAASGELITFCDSDDWPDVDLYGKMIARLEERNADAVICSSRRYLRDRQVLGNVPDGLELGGEDALARMDEIPALNAMMTKVLRRGLCDLSKIEYPEDFCIAEDYCFMVQVLARCRKLVSVRDAYYNYRINVNSMTRSGNVRRLVAHHEKVYDILTRNVPGACSVSARRNLARQILFWGVVGGVFGSADYQKWRAEYMSLEGCWDWLDKSLWGQRIMKVANRSFAASRLMAVLVGGRVRDYL